MRFRINRKVLLECLKSMIRVVPAGCKLIELEGFLVECSEDDGFLYLTATNLETSIQRKVKAEVETGGSFVIGASQLLDMSALLGGEDVDFRSESEGWVIITSGSTVYTVPVLNAKNYPKPDMPFPEHMLKVTGLCDIYARTASSSGTDKANMSLMGIHLDIYSDTVRAAGCDASRMALLKKPADTGGKLSVTIPKPAFFLLACAVGNGDVLEVGIDGKFVVFMKESLLFATRMIEETFLDVDMVLNYHDRRYCAEVEVDRLRQAVEGVCSVANHMNELAVLKMTFLKGGVQFCFNGDTCHTNMAVPGNIEKPMETGFFYPVGKFADCFKTVKGKAEMLVSSQGILLVSDDTSQYMLVNVREPEKKEKEKKTKKAA